MFPGNRSALSDELTCVEFVVPSGPILRSQSTLPMLGGPPPRSNSLMFRTSYSTLTEPSESTMGCPKGVKQSQEFTLPVVSWIVDGGIDEELSVPPVLPSKIKSGLVTCKGMATTTAPSCRIAIFGIPARHTGVFSEN